MMTSWLELIASDVRVAFRRLRNSPRFAAIAIVTLALGVGANVAIFSVVKALLLKQLPYSHPDQLVFLSEAVPDTPGKPDIDFTVVSELVRRSDRFESVASYSDGVGDLMEAGEPEVIRSLHVSSNFFATLGVPLLLGRTFTDEEERPGPNRAIILSYGFWQRRFGGNPGIIGRVLRFDDEHPIVVGVLPGGFEPLIKGNSEMLPETYTPLTLVATLPCHRCQAVRSVARLATGTSPARATADLRDLFSTILREDPTSHHPQASLTVTPVRERVFGRMTIALRTVFFAVGVVLLIACANVASLALAKALGREKEMSVRIALGASRVHLAIQLLVESVLVSLIAGLVGTIAAVWATSLVVTMIPPDVPRVANIRVDGPVLLFALAVSVVTGILFGLAPAVWAFRGDFHDVLRGSRGNGMSVRRRTLDVIVVAEIAMAFVLVVAATLVSRSYVSLMQVDPGYDPQNVLTLSTRLWSRTYRNSADGLRYYHDVMERVRAVPGVQSAAFTSAIPMDTPSRVTFHLAGQSNTSDAVASLAQQYSVSPDYFSVLRIRLLSGRLFSEQDTPDSTRVAIVNATFARRVYGATNPIGQQIKLGDLDGTRPWLTIVGVVADVRQDGLDEPAGPQVYIAEPQELMMRFYRLVARTGGDPTAWRQPVTAAFLSVDREVPVFHVKSLAAYVNGTVADRRFSVALLLLFGAIAVPLAMAGVYGLVSYSTALRLREFGVRLALGASPQQIINSVLRKAGLVTTSGLGIGAIVSMGLTRYIDTLLYGVRSYNSETYLLVTVLIAGTALVASAIPARRAGRLDPVVALREE